MASLPSSVPSSLPSSLAPTVSFTLEEDLSDSFDTVSCHSHGDEDDREDWKDCVTCGPSGAGGTHPQFLVVDVELQFSHDVGSHVFFVNSQLCQSLEWGCKRGMRAMQVYMGAQRAYQRTRIQPFDIAASKKIITASNIQFFTHSPVIYNLAGSSKLGSLAWTGNEKVDSMMEGLLRNLNYELDVIEKVGGKGTVIHPGFYIREKGKSQSEIEEDAIQAIAKTLDMVKFPGQAKVILENCAGESGKVAYSLEQLARIRDASKNKTHIDFCMDTAHVHGSGVYNLSTLEGVSQMFTDFDHYEQAGRGKVCLIHLNDSRYPLNSKKDGHTPLRTGYIWSKDDSPLRLLLQLAHERKIPMVLETSPSDMMTLYRMLYIEKE